MALRGLWGIVRLDFVDFRLFAHEEKAGIADPQATLQANLVRSRVACRERWRREKLVL